MGTTIDNLCNTCTNIGCIFQSGIVRTKCAFYMPPHIEPDNCGNYAVMQPTVEALPKADYETQLKADMVAMLEDILKDFEKAEPWDRPIEIIQKHIDRLEVEGANSN